jgi:hypothetical protein
LRQRESYRSRSARMMGACASQQMPGEKGVTHVSRRAAPAGTGRDPQFDQLGGSISTSSDTSVEAVATVLDIALFYIRRGWNPVPIPFKKKKPIDRDWQKRIIDEATAPRFFNGGGQNIGIQLGPRRTA